MMRILCLHGHGTNSQIFEAQLEPVRSRLPAHWEFSFLDGEMDAPPAPGIHQIYPGPYLCFHGDPIPEDVIAAYQLVMDVVRDEGPFDGVIGFSQGAALAATIIATEARKIPDIEPFKFAIFFSATMPFDFTAGYLHIKYDGEDTLKAVHRDSDGQNLKDNDIDWIRDCRASEVIEEFQSRRPRIADALKEVQSVDVLLRFHPSIHGQRISIPTVHIIGLNDDMVQQGRNLAGICDPKIAKIVTHNTGHQLPRDAETLDRVADAVQWAAERTGFYY